MLVDFHVHSTASDGTWSAEEIVRSAAGFSAVALTDHDNTDGVPEFLSANAGEELKKVCGIELSIESGEGFDRFHLLGLGIDHENEDLKKFLNRIVEGRNGRNEKMLENFGRIGINIPLDELASYVKGDVLARPHFARWLVDNAYASSISEAFSKYLLSDSPDATRCYEDRWHPSQEEAFNVIHRSGGLAVMAHPKYWRNDWKRGVCDYEVAEKELARLKEMGLDGIESLYQANTVEENIAFTRLADKLKLMKTAGSDFHGSNKANITLGIEVQESFIAPFLEAVNLVK